MTDTWMEGVTPVRRLPNGVLLYDGWPLGKPDPACSGVKKVPAESCPKAPLRGSIPRAAATAALLSPMPPSFVYFLHDPGTDWIKIGFTTNPEQRMAALTAGSARRVLALIPGTIEDEKRFHAEFANILATGREWFFKTPAIEARIAALSLPSPSIVIGDR